MVEKQFRGPSAALKRQTQEMFSALSNLEHNEKTAIALQTVADSQVHFIYPLLINKTITTSKIAFIKK